MTIAPPIKLVQTADPDRYRPLFDITSKASVAFCARRGVAFEPFIGIKRGCHPWHATFNRIALLADACAAGYRGWVIYLDADAYPCDPGFDIQDYLGENARFGLIGARGGAADWNVNAGILLLDLSKPAIRTMIVAWQEAFERQLPDTRLASLETWPDGGPDDQTMLHEILQSEPACLALLKIEPFGLIGWPDSSFLRQLLRNAGSFEERCEMARSGVARAIGDSTSRDRPSPPVPTPLV